MGRDWAFWQSVDALVGLPVAEALARAEAMGLLFRDMTPPNTMGPQAMTNRCVNVTCDDSGVVTSAIIY